MEQNPELIDRPDLTSQAAGAAFAAGLQRGTDDFNNAVKANFDTTLRRDEAQANPAMQATPQFFEPPPQPASSRPDRASIYSAPVSRQVPGTGYREPSPRQVKLSPIEQEIARGLKISDVEYAQGKLRLAREKATGERQQ